MKKFSWAKRAFAFGLAAACVCGVAGCSSTATQDSVAATVNGVEIPESKVTASIESVREQQSLTDEASWGEWLASNGYTPESVREEVLDGLINKEVLLQNAESRGVTVGEDEVQSYVDKMKANYDSDEAWNNALVQVGLTEDDYRENIRYSLIYQGVVDTFEDAADDATVLSYAQMYAASYDGAKKSSHILFDANDEATAQQVLDQINAGTLDFAAAAEEYSKDTGSAADGGNVGWDKLSSFVTEYTDALDQLSEGQVSGLVTSSYGIHIIKCTQVFTAPEEVTSIDQLPTEFVDAIRQAADSSAKQTAYSNWLNECRDNSDVVINDMPASVSYNVDMGKYSDEEETSSGEQQDATGGESADTTEDNAAADSSSGTEAEQADVSEDAATSEQPAETTE